MDTKINVKKNPNFIVTPIKAAPIKTRFTNKISKVVTGDGVSAVAVATLVPKDGARPPTRAWRVLLDSGSDGDLIFVKKADLKHTNPEKRTHPNIWGTSNGAFKTTKVGNVEMKFPEFSRNKIFSLNPDIIQRENDAKNPMFDMIIGVETLTKFGVILDFSSKTLTIDHHTITMRPLDAFSSVKTLNHVAKREIILTNDPHLQFPKAPPDPLAVRQETERTMGILDATYEKADLSQVIQKNCAHLNYSQKATLLKLLQKYEVIFDGTLGDFQTDPVGFDLIPGAKAYHGRAFPVPHAQKAVFKKEVKRLVGLGVLKPQPRSEWGSPAFIIAKKDGTVRFLGDFREVNKRIVRTPFPIPKISDVLHELEGFTFATAIDLNMGYWTIRLDPDAQKICTIILPWGEVFLHETAHGCRGSARYFSGKNV